MKTYLIILVLLTGVLNQVTGQVTVRIINTESLEGISYATIEATKENGHTKYYVSDSIGVSRIDTSKVKLLSITKVGYERKVVKLKDLGLSENIIHLSQLDDVLEGVEVRVSRPIVTSTASKITYDVARDSTLSNSNAAEAVSRLPFINIDGLNNISYKNKRSFIVLVNGNRFGLISNDPNSALKSIPASMISSVELILDPPLEFKQKGYDAVINIKTLPGYFRGALGSVGGSINSQKTISGTPYLSLQRNKTYLQINAAGRSERSSRLVHTNLIDHTNETEVSEITDYLHKMYYHRFSVSLDQQVTRTIRAGLYTTTFKNTLSQDGRSDIVISKGPGIESRTQFSSYDVLRKTFEIGGDISKTYGPRANNFGILFRHNKESSILQSNVGATGLRRDNFNQSPLESTIQANNRINFRNENSFETVLKYIKRESGGSFVKDSLVNDKWLSLEPAVSDLFAFKIATLSNGYTIRDKKFTGRVGLNIDHAQYNAFTPAGTVSKEALNFLPFLSSRVLLPKNNFLSLSFVSQLYRPSFRMLASFIPGFDPLVQTVGNSSLMTTITNILTVEHSFYLPKGQTSGYTLFTYEFSNNMLNSYSTYDSATKKRIITYRHSKYRSPSLTIGADITLTPKLSTNNNFSLQYVEFADNYQKPAYSISTSTVYKISKSTGVQLSIDYKSKAITSTGYTTNYGTYDLNIYKVFTKQRLTVNFIASNFFKRLENRKEIITNESFTTTIRNIYPFRSFLINFNFRFGNLKTFEMKAKRVSTTDIKSE